MLSNPSPNFGPRRGATGPRLIVLHYTAMETAEEAIARLCDPKYEVSAHYLIAADGKCTQLVKDTQRAWHAGQGAWGAIEDVNSWSLGIELAHRGDHPFSWPQMRALLELLARLRDIWEIPPKNVIAHSDLAPTRKSDPGPKFDWQCLADHGHAIWPNHPQAQAPVEQFSEAAARFGYPVVHAPIECILRAFRLRFRPWATGVITPEDAGVLYELADRFPVDLSPRPA